MTKKDFRISEKMGRSRRLKITYSLQRQHKSFFFLTNFLWYKRDIRNKYINYCRLKRQSFSVMTKTVCQVFIKCVFVTNRVIRCFSSSRLSGRIQYLFPPLFNGEIIERQVFSKKQTPLKTRCVVCIQDFTEIGCVLQFSSRNTDQTSKQRQGKKKARYHLPADRKMCSCEKIMCGMGTGSISGDMLQKNKQKTGGRGLVYIFQW